jgi:hypothetical protein
VAKARRGGKHSRPSRRPGGSGDRDTGREHWRADGVPKTRFATREEANRSSLQARLERGADLDPYQCGFCGGWHLGNRPG